MQLSTTTHTVHAAHSTNRAGHHQLHLIHHTIEVSNLYVHTELISHESHNPSASSFVTLLSKNRRRFFSQAMLELGGLNVQAL
jgi:hypothetical protein